MKSKRIILYLHPTLSTQVSWIISNDAGEITQSIFNGDLSQFPTDTVDYDVFIFVPTEQVLLTHVELPKLPRQRLMQALPFALEEQLIDDVAELHFALGEYQPNNTWPVAIISQKKMTEWLQFCEEIRVKPLAFIPSIFMLPAKDNSWAINTDETHCLVHTGQYSGFACEKQNLDILLNLKLAEENDQTAFQLIRTETPEMELLNNVAKTLTLTDSINLLQGTHQPKAQTTQTKKIWVVTAYLALALIALGFFSQLVSFFILNRQATTIETAINTLYKKNFPNAKSIVAPRERMVEKLRSLQGSSEHSSLLVLLGQIGKTISELKSIRIANLEFKEKQLTLEVTTNEFSNLDKFTSLLTKEGLSIKQQNAATAGAQVKATILIRQGTTT